MHDKNQGLGVSLGHSVDTKIGESEAAPQNKWPEDKHAPQKDEFRDYLQSGETATDRLRASEGPTKRADIAAEGALVTEGARRVRINFNVSGSKVIDVIKTGGARLIDLIYYDVLPDASWNEATKNEFARNKAKALTMIEDGVSAAVKAYTTMNQ